MLHGDSLRFFHFHCLKCGMLSHATFSQEVAEMAQSALRGDSEPLLEGVLVLMWIVDKRWLRMQAKNAGNKRKQNPQLSGPDPLHFLRVALRIEISIRCVFCVAGRIFIGFLSLPNLVLKLNLNMPERLRVEAAYRSDTLAYCWSNPRFETSGHANSSTKMAY